MIFMGQRFPLQVYLSLIPIVLGVAVLALDGTILWDGTSGASNQLH